MEIVGSWDPHKKVATVKGDRITYWLGQGAQPSDTVYNLLVSQGIVEGKKRAVKIERPVKEVTNDKEQETSEKGQEMSDKKQATGDKKEDVKEEKKEEMVAPVEAKEEI